MIQVSPLSGYKNVTVFSYIDTAPADSTIINWGDGTLSTAATATHTYGAIGRYEVFDAFSCSSTSAFLVSVFDGNFFTDKILVTSDAISSNVSTYHTFTINLSSKNANSNIILYVSGSDSAPYEDNRNLWSHLTPEWEFRSNGKVVSELQMVGTPVFSGTHILGYTSTSAVQFLDDMPGQVILFFTVEKLENEIPMNSRVYTGLPHSISAVAPNILYITSDGIKPINDIQWSDTNIPYVISVGNTNITSTNILHYISGSIQGMDFRAGCYGSNLSAIQYDYTSISLTDDGCFPTGGYMLSSIFYPTSALNDVERYNNSTRCDFDPTKLEFTTIRKTPSNVTLSATGTFYYYNSSYQLTGISDPFTILAFENRHDFYRKGEDYTVYDILKTSLPIDLSEHPNLNKYFEAIAGQGDTLGKVYDKIRNFTSDHSDLDVCTYDALINKTMQFDSSIDDFGLELPEELKRIFNFTTIPLQKLIGTRCVCNTNFVDCAGCATSDICKICRFDKRSNLGDIITKNDYITAGEILIYKEEGGNYFNFHSVQPQNTNTYTLGALTAEPIYSTGITKYCFYRWDKTPQNNPVESVVNYKDSRNLLNPSLSSNADWYGDNGVVEEIFNYILTKNLIGSN